MAAADLQKKVSRTIGHCADAGDSSLGSCKDVSGFPISNSGFDYDFHSSYVTGLDTLDLKNISLRCGTVSGDHHYFATVDGAFSRLAVDIYAHTKFPPITINAPCTPGKACDLITHDEGFHFAARVACQTTSSFKLQLDPKDEFTLTKPLKVAIEGLPDIDVTDKVIPGIREGIGKATFPCPKYLGFLCKAICKDALTHDDGVETPMASAVLV